MSVAGTPSTERNLPSFVEHFNSTSLHPKWCRLCTPYVEISELETINGSHREGLTLVSNAYSSSNRDQPAALLRKQKSLNMTFTAFLLTIESGLQYRQSVGISVYLSEFQHQDMGMRKCGKPAGLCVYTSLIHNESLCLQLSCLSFGLVTV